jgi:hypothetical protein
MSAVPYFVAQGYNKINFPEFKRALEMIAEVKGLPVEEVQHTVCASDGPLVTRMVLA